MSSSIAIERAYVASNQELATNNDKPYRFIAIIEDSGYYNAANKWIATGKIYYGVRVHGTRRMRDAARIQTGDQITTTIRDIQVNAFINPDGVAQARIFGTAAAIGVVSTRDSRTSRPAATEPKEQAKAIAAATAERKREERSNTQNDDTGNTPTKFEGMQGKQPNETAQQYRARQKRQGAQADRVNKASKAKSAKNADKPQPTDVIMCKGTCGKSHQRRDMTKAGYCDNCKQTRTKKPTDKPAAEVDPDTFRRELYSESRA